MKPVPQQDQRAIIKDVFKKNEKLTAGDTWYLISFKWFKFWKENVGYDMEGDKTPVPSGEIEGIDNTELVAQKLSSDAPPVLRANLVEDYDYVLLPEQAWNLLTEWYVYCLLNTRLSCTQVWWWPLYCS